MTLPPIRAPSHSIMKDGARWENRMVFAFKVLLTRGASMLSRRAALPDGEPPQLKQAGTARVPAKPVMLTFDEAHTI